MVKHITSGWISEAATRAKSMGFKHAASGLLHLTLRIEATRTVDSILSVGLVPELRGQRVGSDMLHRMIEWTRGNGGRKIYVDTGHNNILTDTERGRHYYSRRMGTVEQERSDEKASNPRLTRPDRVVPADEYARMTTRSGSLRDFFLTAPRVALDISGTRDPDREVDL